MAIVQHSFLDGKVCTKCKEWKPSSSFNPRSDNGKLRPWCVDCNRQYKQRHRDQHREMYSKTRKAYYAANSDRVRYKMKAVLDAHPERRARAVQRMAEWAKQHPDRYRIQVKVKDAKRRDRIASASYKIDDWIALCEWFGNMCLCCQRSCTLEADHVIPLARGGINTIENLQPLCRSCNARKNAQTIDYRDPDRLANFLKSIGH